MELVNRENNFNKMFNNNGPNIGIINPLNSNTRVSKEFEFSLNLVIYF